MKAVMLISVFLLCVFISSIAQENSRKSLKLYKVRVSKMDNTGKKEGILFEIRPSSIIISDSYEADDYLRSNFNVTEVAISDIDDIILRETIHIHGSRAKFDEVKIKLNSYALIPIRGSDSKKISSFSLLPDTVLDFDKNVYHTVAIGEMVWLIENLKVTHFRNGKEIPEINDSVSWVSAPSAAYCNYRNSTSNVAGYGRLYNWHAVSDSSELCPEGWHVPSIDDWTILVNSLGGYAKAGGYLKESGISHWAEPNKTLDANNIFALPGGSRDPSGTFSEPGDIGQWWIFNGRDAEDLKGLSLYNNSTAVMTFRTGKNSGLSVRCIRDR
jgi:uncharacterized protein (TIGR02145 family)